MFRLKLLAARAERENSEGEAEYDGGEAEAYDGGVPLSGGLPTLEPYEIVQADGLEHAPETVGEVEP